MTTRNATWMPAASGLILASTCLLLCHAPALAESRRIVVYPISQHYVDTRGGDTLSEIAARLLPEHVALQQTLMSDIIRLNPQAFIEHDANRLRANVRLWLPNQLQTPDTKADGAHSEVENYSWGSIKRTR